MRPCQIYDFHHCEWFKISQVGIAMDLHMTFELRNLELRQLRYFVTVAEELHFGKAAVRLHMTQPPLSQTIQGLEELLGAALFERNRRGVALTPAGQALLPEARRLLAQAQELPQLVQRAAAGEVGRLTLAFISSADYSVLPPFLRAYRAAYPQVQITLQEATSDLQLDDLLHNRIDAGLLIPPLPDKARLELDYLPVLREPLMVAMPAGLATPAGAGPVTLVELPPLPLIIFPRAISPALYVDVHPGVEGMVTLNALDQTLPQLLSRIQRQVDMRYEINGGTLTVQIGRAHV